MLHCQLIFEKNKTKLLSAKSKSCDSTNSKNVKVLDLFDINFHTPFSLSLNIYKFWDLALVSECVVTVLCLTFVGQCFQIKIPCIQNYKYTKLKLWMESWHLSRRIINGLMEGFISCVKVNASFFLISIAEHFLDRQWNCEGGGFWFSLYS